MLLEAACASSRARPWSASRPAAASGRHAGGRCQRRQRGAHTRGGRRGSDTSAAPSLSAPTSWSSPSPSRSSSRDRLDQSHGRRRPARDAVLLRGGPPTAASPSAAAPWVSCAARASAAGSDVAAAGEMAAHGLTWLFPQLKGVRFDGAWSGPKDIAARLALLQSAPGQQGARGSRLLRARARRAPRRQDPRFLVLGADDEWSRMPVVGPPLAQLPPEPLAAGANRALWPTRRATARTSGAGARACFLARSSPPTAARALNGATGGDESMTGGPGLPYARRRARVPHPGVRRSLEYLPAQKHGRDPPRTLVWRTARPLPASAWSNSRRVRSRPAPARAAGGVLRRCRRGRGLPRRRTRRPARPGATSLTSRGRRRPRRAQPRRFHAPHRPGFPKNGARPPGGT